MGVEIAREIVENDMPVEKALVRLIKNQGWILYAGDSIEIVNEWTEC